MGIIARYASLVKFAHTIFALPFALMSYTFAVTLTGVFEWRVLAGVLLCMVFARNAAMSFNRIADRHIDARNPRTASREIPSGKIRLRSAVTFCAVNCALFVAVAALINPLAGWLSPVALAVILGYSYTKRFTWASHLVLGVALSIAPVGAWVAVTESISPFSLILAVVVLTWVGGFDIIYSLQDREFDRAEGLHSAPAHFSVGNSLAISILLHAVSVAGVVIIGFIYIDRQLYWLGTLIFAGTLIAQHLIASPKRFDRTGPTFTLINGIASICYCLCAVGAMLVSM